MSKVSVDISDLQKIEHALYEAYLHHDFKDQMNAKTHLTPVVHSPLTTVLKQSWERLTNILGRNNEET